MTPHPLRDFKSLTAAPVNSNAAEGTAPVSAITRRSFLGATSLATAAWLLNSPKSCDARGAAPFAPWTAAALESLPQGTAPMALDFVHFPDRLHAFIWRNWTLVPIARLAEVVNASAAQILQIGRTMGLLSPSNIPADQERRSSITIIRRNWHLLPYSQLLQLLGWAPEQLAFALREDDFLFVKLGNLKPKCQSLWYSAPAGPAVARAERIGQITRHEFSMHEPAQEPLFEFVKRLSQKTAASSPGDRPVRFAPRFCYSYFALYGDPLLATESDPYPDGYLKQLSASGVDGVWLQAVLQKLALFPWDSNLSARYQERIANLRQLVERAKRKGIGIYIYLNEPRSLPLAFFKTHPELRGAAEGSYAALCTSHPDVQEWLVNSIASVCRAVPDLAGFFTITASENFTNCWSHGGGANCPRCAKRPGSEVIAEVNRLIYRGIQRSGTASQLIVWDWGWPEDWAEAIINQLPNQAAFMSVSEWDTPIARGGIPNRVGEYSISTIGPGPRAQKHWNFAQKRGLKTLAKIQAGNTWELSAVPYIPALENVARHASNLAQTRVDGLMLGWTLGGYPSPNLEVVAEVARLAGGFGKAGSDSQLIDPAALASQALDRVATRRFGKAMGPSVAHAWHEFSLAFSEFPFDGNVVYNAPLQCGPSNLLWAEPTKYHATMVGIPYDDLEAWRGPYPATIFISQLEKVAAGFERATDVLSDAFETRRRKMTAEQQRHLAQEMNVAEAAAIHFRSTANQARFVQTRRELEEAGKQDRSRCLAELERLLRNEIALARRLYQIQTRDSRIGFEASNQYYYVPLDLVEKVLNCRDLLERWLPAQV